MLLAIGGGSSTAFSQTTIGGKQIHGVLQILDSLPSSCSPGTTGDTVILRTGPTIYTCTAENTYTAIAGAGSGGGSGLTVQSSGTAVAGGPVTTLNILAGNGVSCIPQVVAGVLSLQCDADTAYLATKANLQGSSNPQICTSSSGSGAAYLAGCAMTLNAYAAKQTLFWFADVANSAGTPTLNIDALGAKALVKQDGGPLSVGMITAGTLYRIWYDGTSIRVAEAGSGGGGVSAGAAGAAPGLTRTINLPFVGCNNAVAGTTFGSVTATGGVSGTCNSYSTANFPGTGTPAMMWQLRWPEDWDNSVAVAVRFATTNPSYFEGAYQFDFSAACLTAGSTYNSPSYSTALSSGSRPLPNGPTISDNLLSGLATGSCTAGDLFYLKAERNQSATNNSASPMSLLNVALIYTAK